MIAGQAPLVGVLITLAVLMVVAAALMLMREATASRLDQRIDELIPGQGGLAGQAVPLPLGGFGRLLRRLGERLGGATRFYSEQDLGALESAITAAGMNAPRVLPMILGTKALLAVLIPVSIAIAWMRL